MYPFQLVLVNDYENLLVVRPNLGNLDHLLVHPVRGIR